MYFVRRWWLDSRVPIEDTFYLVDAPQGVSRPRAVEGPALERDSASQGCRASRVWRGQLHLVLHALDAS